MGFLGPSSIEAGTGVAKSLLQLSKRYQNTQTKCINPCANVRASAVMTNDNNAMSMTAISMTLSAKSSALHPGSQLLSTLIWLLVPSTSTSISLALHFSFHSPTSHLPSPLPHPYTQLRAPVFCRISRNRVQASNPHLNKSFEMKFPLMPCWEITTALGIAVA